MSSSESVKVAGCFIAVVLVIAIGALFAWIAAMLWNGILVPTFGAPPLTFWQVWGLIILINLLFGGLRSVNSSSSK